MLIAFADGPLVAAPTWTRIDDTPNLVAEIEINTGKQTELDVTETGTAVVRINDTEGLFDPDNTGSPYFGNLDGKQILIQLYNPVTATWFPRFRGIIDEYGYDLNPATSGGVSIISDVQIECVDIMDYLAGVDLIPGVHGNTPPAGSEGTIFYEDGEVDARIIQVLADLGIDPDMYVVFSGNVDVQESLYDPGDKALVALRDAGDAEFPGLANIYVDRFGRFVFHGRGARIDPDGVSAGAGDAAWDFQRWYAGDGAAIVLDPTRAQIRPPVQFSRARNRLINSALCFPKGVTETVIPTLVFQDATSIAAYGVHSESWSELIVAGHKTNGDTADDQCLKYSTFWVTNFKDPRTRVQAVTIKAMRPDDPRAAETWRIMTRSDISDILDLEVGVAGGVGVAGEYFIEGWHQTIRPLNPTHDMVELSLNLSSTADWADPDNVFEGS